jgi:MFS family permease
MRYVTVTLREFIVVPMRDRGFRYYVGYSATMAVAMSVAGPFFWLYCLEQLGFAKLAVNLAYMVVAPLAAIGAARIWGTLMDRWGRRPTLFAATSLVVFSAIPYFFCTPTLTGPAFVREGVNWVSGHLGGLWGQPGQQWIPLGAPVGAWLWVALSCVIGGAGWSGIMLAQMGVLMSFADGPQRGRYVAGSAALIGLGGMLGGYVGGQVAGGLSYLSSDPIRIGSLVLTNLHATFALSILARFTGLLWLFRMPDPGSGRIRDLVRQMRTSVFEATTRLYYSFRLQSWTRHRRRRAEENDDRRDQRE